ncbi:MAG: transposase family protein [Crocosphaera sp.]|nr:transposase family protein [Crocosphaera sp.]
MKRQLTKRLSLPGVSVKSQKQLENTLILEGESNSKKAVCPRCHKSSSRLHQNHYSLIKDIPWGEIEVFLRVKISTLAT